MNIFANILLSPVYMHSLNLSQCYVCVKLYVANILHNRTDLTFVSPGDLHINVHVHNAHTHTHTHMHTHTHAHTHIHTHTHTHTRTHTHTCTHTHTHTHSTNFIFPISLCVACEVSKATPVLTHSP